MAFERIYNRRNAIKYIQRTMQELKQLKAAAQEHKDERTVIQLEVALSAMDSTILHLDEEIARRRKEKEES